MPTKLKALRVAVPDGLYDDARRALGHSEDASVSNVIRAALAHAAGQEPPILRRGPAPKPKTTTPN